LEKEVELTCDFEITVLMSSEGCNKIPSHRMWNNNMGEM